jgi:predicted dithiol-disulfide oxidoreductase (DUF899 family)
LLTIAGRELKRPKEIQMPEQRIGTQEEWQAAFDELLAEEKKHTRRGDELAEKRRSLPWVPVQKDYELETSDGTKSLTDLFDGRSQLLVYHFMFGPNYEAGCTTCSSMADGLDGLLPHLHARDLTLAFVSRAPIEKLRAYQERMGWSIPWASSANSDFSFDMGASVPVEQVREQMPPEDELEPIARRNAEDSGVDVPDYIAEIPSTTAFALENGNVYKTYATTFRGVEFLMPYYPVLDRAPKGRDEGDAFQMWIRRHDEYS